MLTEMLPPHASIEQYGGCILEFVREIIYAIQRFHFLLLCFITTHDFKHTRQPSTP